MVVIFYGVGTKNLYAIFLQNHHVVFDVLGYDKQYVEDIIRKCAEKDIKVLIVNSPLYKSYLDNQKNEYLEQQKSFCNYFAENYSNVELYDFRGDIRFTENDFYDSNHLNEIGSKKFTMILDSVIVNQ